jgi:hypothetical protein
MLNADLLLLLRLPSHGLARTIDTRRGQRHALCRRLDAVDSGARMARVCWRAGSRNPRTLVWCVLPSAFGPDQPVLASAASTRARWLSG